MNHALIAFVSSCFLLLTASAQSPDLANLQSKLTVDCKSIRGHAGRIVAESGEQEFNVTVAVAHLKQVANFHSSMEKDLVAIAKVLSAAQGQLVAHEMKQLDEICKSAGSRIGKLEDAFNLAAPDRETIRRESRLLRETMAQGHEIHERMKKKLGIL